MMHGIKTFLLILLSIGLLYMLACDSAERSLVPNTHDGRVPEVIDFTAVIDSSVVNHSLYIVKLRWRYDTVKYSSDMTKANLKNWEVYRIIGADTNTVKFQLQRIVQSPQFTDSSFAIQPAGRDKVTILYRILPIGNVVDNVQFTGKPSDILRVELLKK
jgi:hypothetical protein